MRNLQAVLLSFAAVFVTGCYTYTEVPDVRPRAHTEVRVYVTREFNSGLGTVIVPDRRRFEGQVIDWDEFGVTFNIPMQDTGHGFGTPYGRLSQRLIVPWQHIVELEEKRLDRKRTVGLVAGIGAGALLFRHLLFGGTSMGGTLEDEVPPIGDH